MANIFDKITGTSTSFDENGITDNTKNFTVNYYVGWFIVINSVEYKITANTATTISFENSIVANSDYSIRFVGRTFLTELESDASNDIKIPDSLIDNKYNQVNVDITNKVFAYLRKLTTKDFDPLANILNLIIMQQTFAYLLLSKVYNDLTIDQNSFESFKAYNTYDKNYNDTIKDSLALLQIDFNEDGEANYNEITSSASTYVYLSR